MWMHISCLVQTVVCDECLNVMFNINVNPTSIHVTWTFFMLIVVNHIFFLGELQTAPPTATLRQFVTHLLGLMTSSCTLVGPLPISTFRLNNRRWHVQGKPDPGAWTTGREISPAWKQMSVPCAAVSFSVQFVSRWLQVLDSSIMLHWLSSGCKSDNELYGISWWFTRKTVLLSFCQPQIWDALFLCEFAFYSLVAVTEFGVLWFLLLFFLIGWFLACLGLWIMLWKYFQFCVFFDISNVLFKVPRGI
jgi:hypothetical protein